MVAGLSLGAARCDSTILPTPTQGGPTETSIVFTGTLETGASSFFSFQVTEPQVLSVMFASTMADINGPATPTVAGISLGIPGGTDCVPMIPAVVVAPAFTSQIAMPLEVGTYCVRIADVGHFPGPMIFAVRMVLASASLTPNPGVDSFASSLAIQGASSRTFTATQSGAVNLTLQSLGAGASTVGLGLGIPRVDGTGCLLTQSIMASPGSSPQLSAQVAAGKYCAKIFDTGSLSRPVTFVLQIVRP
jgi:hypothetical protein